jgi:hypothetical protein
LPGEDQVPQVIQKLLESFAAIVAPVCADPFGDADLTIDASFCRKKQGSRADRGVKIVGKGLDKNKRFKLMFQPGGTDTCMQWWVDFPASCCALDKNHIDRVLLMACECANEMFLAEDQKRASHHEEMIVERREAVRQLLAAKEDEEVRRNAKAEFDRVWFHGLIDSTDGHVVRILGYISSMCSNGAFLATQACTEGVRTEFQSLSYLDAETALSMLADAKLLEAVAEGMPPAVIGYKLTDEGKVLVPPPAVPELPASPTPARPNKGIVSKYFVQGTDEYGWMLLVLEEIAKKATHADGTQAGDAGKVVSGQLGLSDGATGSFLRVAIQNGLLEKTEALSHIRYHCRLSEKAKAEIAALTTKTQPDLPPQPEPMPDTPAPVEPEPTPVSEPVNVLALLGQHPITAGEGLSRMLCTLGYARVYGEAVAEYAQIEQDRLAGVDKVAQASNAGDLEALKLATTDLLKIASETRKAPNDPKMELLLGRLLQVIALTEVEQKSAS